MRSVQGDQEVIPGSKHSEHRKTNPGNRFKSPRSLVNSPRHGTCFGGMARFIGSSWVRAPNIAGFLFKRRRWPVPGRGDRIARRGRFMAHRDDRDGTVPLPPAPGRALRPGVRAGLVRRGVRGRPERAEEPRHGAERAAGPEEPPASRGLRLRPGHGRRGRDPDAAPRPVLPVRGAADLGPAAAGRRLRRGVRVPAPGRGPAADLPPDARRDRRRRGAEGAGLAGRPGRLLGDRLAGPVARAGDGAALHRPRRRRPPPGRPSSGSST